MKTYLYTLIVLIAATCSLMVGGGPVNAGQPDTVTVQLKWVHQAQFAGLYLAKIKGYYKEENLTVGFLEGGPGVDISQTLVGGGADFAVTAPEDLLVRRSQGIPLTAIAAIYRRSALVFLSRDDSGIRRPFDFIGKRVAVTGVDGSVRDFELQFFSMLNILGIDPSGIEVLPYDPKFTLFLAGKIDVTATYMTGGLIRLRQMGLRPHVIWPGDYGVHFYSDILVAHQRTIAERPDRVLRFVRASLRGWREAIGDPEAAVAATMTYARIADKAVQAAMLEALMPLVHTGEGPIGWMEAENWQEMIQTLSHQNVFNGRLPDTGLVYTRQFLNAVYPNGERLK